MIQIIQNQDTRQKKKYVVPMHAIKAHRGTGHMASHILKLTIRWSSAVSFTYQPIYVQQKKIPQSLLNRRLGGPHSQFGHFGEPKNLLPLKDLNSRSSSLSSHYTN